VCFLSQCVDDDDESLLSENKHLAEEEEEENHSILSIDHQMNNKQ
jgi:hypothetical protein